MVTRLMRCAPPPPGCCHGVSPIPYREDNVSNVSPPFRILDRSWSVHSTCTDDLDLILQERLIVLCFLSHKLERQGRISEDWHRVVPLRGSPGLLKADSLHADRFCICFF